MVQSISTFIIIIGFIGFYWLCERLFPAGKSKYTSNKNLETLRTLYQEYEFKNQGVFVLSALAIGFTLYYLILPVLLRFRLSFVTDHELLVIPVDSMRMLISVLSGILFAIPISFIVPKRQLKADWFEFLAYMNLRYKFNFVKVTKYILLVYTGLVAILSIIFFDSYCAFGKEEIKINKVFGLGQQTYRYTDIINTRDIQRLYAPNGNVVDDPHFIILFRDGNKWNSRNDGFETYDENKQIIDMVKSKTNLEPIKLEFNN